MRQSIMTVIQLFLFITTMQQSFSQAGNFGRLIYTVPTGWKETKYQHGVQLAIAPAAKELLIIQILQSMDFSGTMELACHSARN